MKTLPHKHACTVYDNILCSKVQPPILINCAKYLSLVFDQITKFEDHNISSYTVVSPGKKLQIYN